MVRSIAIKNYALIEKLDIRFESGLSIITGETGAGKSILLGALALLLGQRADTNVIKNKEDKCVVEAEFDISNLKLNDFFTENDIDYLPQTIIRREIADSGKSRAFINDTPVNLNVLKDLGYKLIDVHSQHETLNLASSGFQLKVVDIYAQNQNLIDEYKTNYHQYKKLEDQLNQLQQKSQQAKADSDYINFQFHQLEEAKITEKELEELEYEQQTLSHAEEIKTNLSKTTFLLEGDGETILYQLKEAQIAMNQIKNFFSKAKDYAERLESSYLELQDIALETGSLIEKIDFEPERLQYINNRMDLLISLMKKHQCQSIIQLIELREKYRNQLAEINSFDEQITESGKKLEIQKKKLENINIRLKKQRISVFGEIEKKILDLLTQLGMPNATFKVVNQELTEYTSNGTDRINFLFSANRNIEMQDIAKVASGGELSRLMLSIKSLMSESKQLPTIIFDEIDTGVSGEIADKIGKIIFQMSENLQVINITHLPQVAAKGHHHYKVYKTENHHTTTTNIRLLTSDERITEIAKMLSGENISDAALQNAKVLLGNN